MKPRNRPRRALPRPLLPLAPLLLLLATPSAAAATQEDATPAAAPAASPEASPDVRLIVVVVVDQMIPEDLERLQPLYTGGLARFAAGEVWHTAEHAHGVTETGPGHTTIGTGVYPRRHGIVSNDWLAKDARGRVYCVEDPDAKIVTGQGPIDAGNQGRSAEHLLAPSMGDWLAKLEPGGKTVAVSGKDRAAIGLTGKTGDLVLWWDARGQGFVSSTAYTDALPEWLQRWDEQWTSFLDAGHGSYTWTSSVPPEATKLGTEGDARPGEADLIDQSFFPHLAPGVTQGGLPNEIRRLAGWVFFTPLIDTFTVEVAKRAVRAEDLGGDDRVDVLLVGLSARDSTGHLFGPYSVEVTDVLLNADRELGSLFDLLDQRIGKDHWIAALSADHGVLPLPEHQRMRGEDAGRYDGKSIGAAVKALDGELTERFGPGILLGFSGHGLRLSPDAMRAAGADPAEVRSFVADRLRAEVPELARVFTLDELLAVPADAPFGDDPIETLMARSTLEGRSPDVEWILPPEHIEMTKGTTHGSPYAYDRRVPLAFFGPGSTPGGRWDAAWTVDVLPTLFARAGLAVPDGIDGHVLK